MAPSLHEDNSQNLDCISKATNDDADSLIGKIKAHIASNDKFFSLEFFPPRTKAGATNLVSRLERMRTGSPLFVDITWHPAGNPSGDTETSSMMISHVSSQYVGLETMLHMTCVGSSKEDITGYLDKAKNMGLRNILALRGDLPNIDEEWQHDPDKFNYATDMVRHIRRGYDKHFTVCVAGYPLGHPEASSYEDDLFHLKEKVEAGSDFIITQLFFKAETFIKFVRDCRDIGITCPIIPGIMPIQSFDSLRHIVKLSKLEVPEDIAQVVEPLKDNNQAIENYGVHQATQMIRELFSAGVAPGVHFYTLNKEVATRAILKNLGLWLDVQRPLPWVQSANPARAMEAVRPLFWRHNHKSYIYRSKHWTEFPQSRWEPKLPLSDCPDLSLFYLCSGSSKAELLKMWGDSITGEGDVWSVMAGYYGGDNNIGVVTRSPWCDQPAPLLSAQLASLCSHGVILVSVQGNVNGEDSSVAGWGQEGGYIYQRPYLEFFLHTDRVQSLLERLSQTPDIRYQIVNREGSVDVSNIKSGQNVSMTWGVFPDHDIVTPSVVDTDMFRAWSEEAYTLWKTRWEGLYEPGSKSQEVIKAMTANYSHGYLLLTDHTKSINILMKPLEDIVSPS